MTDPCTIVQGDPCTEYVYLIGCAENSLVKIGRSNDLRGRLAEIQRMAPVRLDLMWSTEGGWELESRLHRVFRRCRSHGEWFDFTGTDPVRAVEHALAAGLREPSLLPEEESALQAGEMVKIVAWEWGGPKTGMIRSVIPRESDGGCDYYVGDPSDQYLPAYLFAASELRPMAFAGIDGTTSVKPADRDHAEPSRENANPPLYPRSFIRPHHPLRQRGDL